MVFRKKEPEKPPLASPTPKPPVAKEKKDKDKKEGKKDAKKEPSKDEPKKQPTIPAAPAASATNTAAPSPTIGADKTQASILHENVDKTQIEELQSKAPEVMDKTQVEVIGKSAGKAKSKKSAKKWEALEYS